VLSGAIASVTLETITGESQRQPCDQGIAGLLGHHTGGSNRQAVQITGHQRALAARPGSQGQVAIH
jgi:hypothetical protein